MRQASGIRHQASRSARGFTLFELIVVMVLIIVMAGIAAPTFSSFFPALKTQKAAEGILATAGKARADASLTLRRYRLCLQARPPEGNPCYYLACEADPLRDPGAFRPLSGAWGEREELPEDVAFESLDGALDDAATGEKYLEFNPDGTATEGTIALTNQKGDRAAVRVDGTTGKASIEEAAQP